MVFSPFNSQKSFNSIFQFDTVQFWVDFNENLDGKDRKYSFIKEIILHKSFNSIGNYIFLQKIFNAYGKNRNK
jgi:hypothetical protein